MTISDASEIQFWPTGTSSFNLEQEGYTDDYCFHQKFLCSSERKFQGYGTDFDQDYYLIATDPDGVELFNSAFTKENFYTTDEDLEFDNDDFLVSLSPWAQYSGSPGSSSTWTWDASGAAISDGTSGTLAQTYELKQARQALGIGGFNLWPPGDYVFKIRVDNQSFGGSSPLSETMTVKAFNTDGGSSESVSTTVARGGGYVEYTVSLTTTQEWNYFAVIFFKQGPSSGSAVKIYVDYFRIDEWPLDYTFSKYSLSLTPSDEDMCDKKVTFKIYDGPDPETDTEVFYSDSIDFVSTWANDPGSGRIQIQYRSIQNFADLIYDSESEYFNLEIEGRFRKERKVNAQKTIELTERIINTAASVKKQRRLTIDDVPDYMHTKINLILAHAASGSVLINGKECSTEESYEEGDRPGSYPLTPAEVWLTEKEYFKHNVI